MNSVKFGEKDSYVDWGLILKPKNRPLASPKINLVSIEGKDGDLDLTTALTGDVKYNNVSYSLDFTLTDKRENWENKIQEITTYLHGKKMNVIFSENPEWYCVGRMTVSDLTANKSLGVLKISCNFEPYKLKVEETTINKSVKTGDVITLSNSRKWVMPIITSDSNIVFTFEGKSFSINGTLQSPDIILKEGENTIEVTSGTGTLSFKYREGKL